MKKTSSATTTTSKSYNINKDQITKSVAFNDKNSRNQLSNQDLIINLNRIKLNESRKDVFKKRVKNSFMTRFNQYNLCFYLLRVLIILTLTAGWLAMAALPKNVKNFYLFDPDIYKIRIGYLAINIIASGISIFIFAVTVMAPKLIFYCEFITGVIIIDLLLILATAPLGILAILRESSIDPSSSLLPYLNRGSLTFAGVMAIIAVLFYSINIGLSSIYMMIELRILRNKCYEHRCRTCGSHYELMSKSIKDYPYHVLIFSCELKY